jgi:hypothetical protein
MSQGFVRVSGFCAQLSLLSWPPPGSSQRVTLKIAELLSTTHIITLELTKNIAKVNVYIQFTY